MAGPIILPGAFRSGPEFASSQSGAGSNAVGSSKSASRNQGADEAGTAKIRTVEDAMNVLKARLSQRLEQKMGSISSGSPSRFASPSFEAPSAEMVAQRVLGFVQQRLQAEARAGADTDRLAGLLADARAGVEQGFSEAREQIKAMGLMDDQLGAGIDESYGRIQSGLDDLSNQFVQRQPDSAVSDPTAMAGYRVERASESLFSFEVTTEEGDRVTVQMAEQRYSGAAAVTGRSEGRQTSELSAVSGFSGRYSFSVEGDLNVQEQQALAQLFGQVEKVSARFFDGDIQGAFQKAQSLNLGGEALASFSLSLTSTRIVSASAYESVAQQPSANTQLRPLGGLARDLQSVAQSAFDRGVSEPAFKGLLNSLLQDTRQSQRADAPAITSDSLMSEFMKAVIQSLNSPLPQ